MIGVLGGENPMPKSALTRRTRRVSSCCGAALGCLQADPRALNLSRSQSLADVDSLQVLLAHPSHTHERSQARLFVLPLLAEASRQAGRCHGRTHAMRLPQRPLLPKTEIKNARKWAS